MNTTRVKSRSVRFGVFELDVRACELRKSGLKIKLQPQPLQVLLLLLERPGELFTREELRQKLWQADIFVDFDRSLNKAVVKLRESLGDSADSPRYIETLPRLGYRFIAPVEEINGNANEVNPAPPVLEVKYKYSLALRGDGENPQPTSGLAGDISRPVGQTGARETSGTPMDASLPQAVTAALPRQGASGGVNIGVPEATLLRRGLALGLAAFVVALAVAYFFRPTLPPPQVLSSMQITNDGQPKGGMVTDGTRLYFNTLTGGDSKLYQVSTSGGPEAPIDTPVESPILLDISPDHSQLLVRSNAGFGRSTQAFAVPVVGGSTHSLNGISVGDAAWSPNGRQLFYRQGNDLYLASADGMSSRKLATVEGLASLPRWSADGEKIRFSLSRAAGSAERSIWEISADGKGLHQLLQGWNNPPSECCGVWTPDGKYFFFQSSKGGAKNVWAIREGGSPYYKVNHQPVQVTAGPAAIFSTLPSLDGKKLFAITSQARGKLMRYDARTSEFVPYLNGISASSVEFSGDGRWIAYIQYPELTLWRSTIDGSDRVQLTSRPTTPILPRWSPDGALIAFWAVTPGKGWHAYTVAADGTGAPQAIPSVPGEAGEISPGWSPDGKSLVFSGAPQLLTLKSNPTAIHIMDVLTRKVTTLPGSEGLCAPLWSHDGRYIAAQPGDGRRLTVYDLGSGKWSDLGVDSLIANFEWSRDNQAIYFLGSPTGQPSAIFRVRLSDHRMEQVASLAHFRQTPGITGDWMGIAPDNSPLLVEDAGTQDIYALDLKLP